MTSMYGPFTLVAGTLQQQTVDQSAVAVRVTNDSPYDVWVNFGPARPSIPDPLVSQAAYSQVVQAWSSQVLPIPGPNPNTSWQGSMWLLPVNDGNLASSGTISSRAQIYLTAYGVDEATGTNHAVPRQFDATSQQRVISIPTEPHVDGQFAANVSSGTTVNANIFLAIGQTFSGAQPVTCYLYGLDIAIEGFAYGDVLLEWLELDNSNAIIASHPFGKMVMQAERPRSLPLQSALPLQFTPLATCTSVAFGVRAINTFPSTAQTVFAPQVVGTILADIDLTGQVPPPAIGNGAGTPPGAIY